ncbi:hypothetical protein [Phytoactinopolyspora halotolerans]|uniref:DUF3137 domain-containing protein n=1 Tax=Phytoactinopolyspora halotolerans TaxID=1981512 RepID=A0A6L9S9V1_9ACTN|nr:hypothetical protein [Phytoactinopolyspora halotolerans]NEE02155.1 hypothetical protein [Phytoactinopolyspora halotolerans]
MEGTVVVIGATVLAVVLVIVMFTAVSAKRRRQALQELAHLHGWQWVHRKDSLPSTFPPGPPFRGHPRRAKARNVITGRHQDREFVAFEYYYVTTTSTGQHASSTTHYYAVWRIALPASLPPISLGAEGVLGGKFAQAFGFRRMNTGNDEFDRRFKVKCDDQDFGARLLHPAMVNLLMDTGTWAWRIDGNVMLSYSKGHLDADDVLPRLELMNRVLDHVPSEIWAQYGRSPA